VELFNQNARRILEFINRENNLDQNQLGYSGSMHGAIELRNVSFSYPDGHCVLEDISFKIEPGETLALVGQTGAGKTTLVRRMVGYFRPHQKRLAAVVLLLVYIAVSGASVPLIVSHGLDTLGPNLQTNGILLLCGLILFAGVTSWAANWLRRRLVVRMIGNASHGKCQLNMADPANSDFDPEAYDQYLNRPSPVNRQSSRSHSCPGSR